MSPIALKYQKMAYYPESQNVLALHNFDSTAQSVSLVHQAFEESAKLVPNDIAIVCADEEVSYFDLNRRANQIAHFLQERGVGPEILVGVCLERSVNMIAAVLAILKAGGAVVPLDPAYPEERIQLLIEQSRPFIILTNSELKSLTQLTEQSTICLDTEKTAISSQSELNPLLFPSLSNLAYILFTSGSTGTPKGVAMEHRSLSNLIQWQNERAFSGVGSRTLQNTTLSFDVSFQEIFATLCSGGTLVIIPEETRRDGRELLAFIEREKIERLFLPFVALQMLAEAAEFRCLFPPTLREIITAGEPLQMTRQIRRLLAELPHCYLENQYGPTETHVATAYRITAVGQESTNFPPIGKPIKGAQIFLLDENGVTVPTGERGEIYISGDCLARGYLNRNDLTAERFHFLPSFREKSLSINKVETIKNFGKQEDTATGMRTYRTGDLARMLPDGNLEFLGRADKQIKVRGHRIEPGEIEAALNCHEVISQAVVVGIADEQGQNQLIAYLVPREDSLDLNIIEIRDSLRARLPEYMVPTHFVKLNALPLTPAGKVDRLSLSPPVLKISGVKDTFQPARDELEMQMVLIFERSLNIRPISVNDNLFDLGLHSLLAARLFMEIEQVSGQILPLATLIQAPTIAQLAVQMRNGGWQPRWSSLVPLQPGGTKPPFFCVHGGGGHVLVYRDLASRLGTDQPFYGLQPRTLGGSFPPHNSVEEMAQHYISEIRSLQPNGPYHLGGMSYGGIIAFEMARQLKQADEEVALLVMFDTYGPGYLKDIKGFSALADNIISFYYQMEHHFGSLIMLPAVDRIPYWKTKWRKVRIETGEWIVNRSKRIFRLIFSGMGRPLPDSLLETHNSIRTALESYQPAFYSGKVTVFRAKRQPYFAHPDLSLGWGAVSGEIEIQDIPGHHAGAILEPRARIVAAILQDCLERASQ